MIARVRARLSSIRQRFDYPVLTQEMRIRQRGVKPFMLIFVYAFVLAAVAVFVLQVVVPSGFRSSGSYQQDMGQIGRILFQVLAYVQLAMIALIVPAYSAGAVTSERERGTIDLLVLTALRSSEVVTQKLVAATAQALMLTVVSLPVVAVVFLLGGVSPIEVVGTYVLLVLTAALAGALGLLCSSQFKSTKTSIFVAYLSVLLFLIGVPLFGYFLRYMGHYNMTSDTFSFVVAAGYLFVGGAFTCFFYSIAALIARRRQWALWRVRLTRMGVVGGIYALVIGLFATPGISLAVIDVLFNQSHGYFLPLYVNPFVAIFCLVNYEPSTTYYSGPGYGPAAATIIFACLTTHLFKHLSTFRFEAMRRRA